MTKRRAITLSNDTMSARVLTHGARLASLTMPDADGRIVDVALGLPHDEDYAADDVCLGAVIGRNTGRIANARCVIGGREYPLAANDGPNNNHSAPHGFEHADWVLDEDTLTNDRVTLRLTSPDMSQGFPGTLRVAATYALVDAHTLELTLEAQSDRDTVCNLTSHTYWNLDGDGGDTLDHTLQVNADRYFPTDGGFLPFDAEPVEGTPFDLREPRSLREALGLPTAAVMDSATLDSDALSHLRDPQLALGRGFNHAYDFAASYAKASGDAGNSTRKPFPMATLTGARSGISMSLSCDAPSLVVYSAGFFDGLPGRGGAVYGPLAGVALEPGFVPNAINDTHCGATPSPLLRAGKRYRMIIRYAFR